MYDHMNEDAAWQHVQDLQREMENSRLWAARGSSLIGLVALGALETGRMASRGLRRGNRPRRPAPDADRGRERHAGTGDAA
jgi:hypothetical protein